MDNQRLTLLNRILDSDIYFSFIFANDIGDVFNATFSRKDQAKAFVSVVKRYQKQIDECRVFGVRKLNCGSWWWIVEHDGQTDICYTNESGEGIFWDTGSQIEGLCLFHLPINLSIQAAKARLVKYYNED